MLHLRLYSGGFLEALLSKVIQLCWLSVRLKKLWIKKFRIRSRFLFWMVVCRCSWSERHQERKKRVQSYSNQGLSRLNWHLAWILKKNKWISRFVAEMAKRLKVMEGKVIEFRINACLRFHEKECRFLQLDLEALFQVLQSLKQGTRQATYMIRKHRHKRKIQIRKWVIEQGT